MAADKPIEKSKMGNENKNEKPKPEVSKEQQQEPPYIPGALRR